MSEFPVIVNHEKLKSAVNARELHRFLCVGRDYSTWVTARIAQFGFQPDFDYVLTFPRTGDRSNVVQHEYFIAIDMAKELAMVERNEKGREVRRYFIECEKQLRSRAPALPDFSDPIVAARAWADAKESEQKALAYVEAAKPAVEFVEKYVKSTGNLGFREICKLLGINETRFREFLTEERIMYRLAGCLTPYQNHIDAGRFSVKAGVSEANDHAFTQAKFTPKGVEWVSALWRKIQN